MTIPRSVADVLTTRTLFDVECIDRMYLNVYVPGLQYAPSLVAYVHRQLGLPVASTAPLARITDRFSAAVHRFADTRHIPWVDFVKGQRKDDVMHEHLQHFTAAEGVVFVGRAQEKTPLFRTEKRRDALAVITGPVTTATGTRVPGLRFADQRSHALLSALLVFRLHPNGFTNKDLRTLTGELRGLDPEKVSAGQMTYDLRRLKTRNLIVRIEGTHRYRVTNHGLDTAKFLTCVHGRVLRTGLAELATPTTTPGRLRSAATTYCNAVDTLTGTAQLAA
ncbi:hypothetical protein FXW78_42735 [Rhodococcus opacus]|nr:hypothetical protein [Rhodococcus opacus]